MDDIAARVASEVAGKAALLPNYARKKAENEIRAQIEADRMARFEEELRLEKEKKARADADGARVMNSVDRPTAPPVHSSVSQGPSEIQQANQDGWSFDNSVFSTVASAFSPSNENRLYALNRLLQQVNTSLDDRHSDHITNMLAENGPLPLSRLAAEVQEDDVSTAISAPPNVQPCERHAVVFRRCVNVETQDAEISDDFFELSVDDIRTRQKELREEVRMNTQRALIPKRYVNEKNRSRKLEAYQHTVIRISVGGDKIIQAFFLTAEPVSHIFEWVRSILPCKIPFVLKMALNVPLEESDARNLVDADIAPKSTLQIKLENSNSERITIGETLQECSQKEADRLSKEWLSRNTVFKPYAAVVEEDERSGKRPSTMLLAGGSELVPPPHKCSTAPKWLKKK